MSKEEITEQVKFVYGKKELTDEDWKHLVTLVWNTAQYEVEKTINQNERDRINRILNVT